MAGLPEPVRGQVVAFAAAALAAASAEEVPGTLRKVARFTPSKRARLGAAELLAAVESEPAFRQRVVEQARRGAAPVALAYLEQTEGWQEQVRQAAEEHATAMAASTRDDAVERLERLLQAQREAAREELVAAQGETSQAREELAVLRRKVRDLGSRLGRAEQARDEAEQARERAVAELEAARARDQDERRALTDRLADAERAADQVRHAAREGARGDQLRLRLLLDAVVGAAQGLRRELALPPAEGRPADALAADYVLATRAPSAQGRAPHEAAHLEALLTVPTTHLLVDGYNVTKTGYGGLTLEAQRTRLLSGLGALAARTRAEVTVVFDGAEGVVPVALPAPRGVRLLFSRRGETADEVLRRLARHEPPGRPVVVVSSDREVADGVVEAGGSAVPSVALLRLLERASGT